MRAAVGRLDHVETFHIVDRVGHIRFQQDLAVD